MKTKVLFILLLATITGYAQITTTNRDIRKEVTNVNATNLRTQTLNTGYNNRTLLTKIANKSKKGKVNSTWTKPSEVDKYNNLISIPKIAFPGYVRVTLIQNDPDLRPSLVIKSDFNEGGVIITGSSGNTENNQVRTSYFSVHPGMTYDVMVSPFFNADSYNPPIPYTIEWEYTGLQDVYEPNDTRKQAKFIDFNKIISAYAVAGYTKNYVSWSDENTYDWYSVVLKENGKLRVNILDKPKDIDLVVTLYKPSGYSMGVTRGVNSTTAARNLEKGTYFISIHSRLGNGGIRTAQFQSDPIPEHFQKPYKFKVSKL